jgi:phospholipid/cholesterol/gamma-HCH transport system substrate-binding protein
MENRSHALIAGVFTVTLIALAVLLAIWLGRDKIQRVPYEIVTRQAVSGLNLQAAVRYKGIKVGNVTDIDFDPAQPGQIILRLEVMPDTPVTGATFATLGYQGVTGIAFVQLDEDEKHPAAGRALSGSDGGITRIPMRPGALQNLEQRGMAILSQAEELTRRLNQLLAPENQQKLMHTVEMAGKAAEQWSQIPGRLEPGLKQLPDVLHQAKNTLHGMEQLSTQATQLSGNLNTLTLQLQSRDGPLFRFSQTVDLLNQNLQSETLPRLNQLSQDARTSLRSVGQTAEQLRERPQSLLFGNTAPLPGPGEPGFVAPASSQKP